MAKPSTTASVGTGSASTAGEIAFHLVLVGDAVLAAAERLELGDVGAGDEGLAAGAAKHRDAHAVFAAHARAGLAELLVHAPGHGVARRRTVEDHGGNLAVADVADFSVAHGVAPNDVMRGLTRASIFFRKMMDCRVKPGNDSGEIGRFWSQALRRRSSAMTAQLSQSPSP